MSHQAETTRRGFLRAGSLALAAGALQPSACAAAAQAQSLSIGIFTDSHYADLDRRGSRHYRDSKPKLAACVEALNQAKPAFAIVLGDYTDQADGAEQKAIDLKTLDAVYRQFDGPRHYVVGNHDLDVFAKDQFVAATGIPAPHYSFDAGPFHCIVLDANYRKDFSPYRAGNFQWTDTWVPPDEQKWLAADLQKTKSKTLVFVHQRLDDDEGMHGIKNAPDVRRLLEDSGNVLAVFQGHHHSGGYQKINGIPYLTQRAMVEGPGLESNAYALARVATDGSVRIRGFGKQPDRKA
jgi:alkaline phosphatase